ncbi:CvpA family protein [Azohydromonas sediminis]|uniref:CvpA family protein n=1 Tax=Azohydromonas sediminis TaxID=2259674 RepID=UPI000E65C039|nr:CvpA family protein [Azohydromonas sediminis]
MAATLASIGWVDWALLVVVLLSVAVGLWRGLVFEVLSLLGWVAAYVAAQAFTPQVAPHVPVGVAGSGVNHAAAFVVVFVAALVVWALAAQLVRLLIHATPLSVADRTLGGGFGLLRGLLVLLALATVVTLTPAREAPDWRDSVGAQWLTAVLRGLKPMLPGEVAGHLRV